MKSRRMKSRQAFTLVELLVVIAIIGLLVGLLMPAVQAARESARRTQCVNHLKQVGLACHGYHDALRCFPPGYCAAMPYVDGAADTAPGWGWTAFILPFVEQGPVHSSINFSLPVEHLANARAAQTLVPLYLCPSDLTPSAPFAVPDASGKTVALAAPTSYAGCVGSDVSAVSEATGVGVFYRNSATRLSDISDGSSTTILAGEKAWANAQGTWTGAINRGVLVRGASNPCQPVVPGMYFPAAALVLSHAHLNNALVDGDGSAGMDDFSSMHVAGSNFVFADGSVHFIRGIPYDDSDGSYTVEGVIFQRLGTRAYGEPVPPDFVR